VRGYVGAVSFIRDFQPSRGRLDDPGCSGHGDSVSPGSDHAGRRSAPQALAIIGYALFQGGLDH
jgi:hypothetical protein